MKNAILAFILCLQASIHISAQCFANAGPDKIACNTVNGIQNPQLGGLPAASGGTGPYTYRWEANYQFTIGQTEYIYTASDMLNDTTLANPALTQFVTETPIDFILTVTDANNVVCKDTVRVRFSVFYSLLGYMTYTIQQGDSIHLNQGSNITGGIAPLHYLWKPNHGLTDSTSLDFWAKPDHSIQYYVTVTDSAGCIAQGSPFYYVNVNPVSVIEEISKSPITVYPNPTSGILIFKLGQPVATGSTLVIYNQTGQIILQKTFTIDVINQDINNLPQGHYHFAIIQQQNNVYNGNFIVE